MDSQNKTVGCADAAMAFVGGINSIAPLISTVTPDIDMTVRLVLEDTDKEAFIDLGARPPKVEFGKLNRDAGITLFIKARDFHDVLLGRLSIIKAWNDKRALIEMTPSALAGMPERKPTASDDPIMVPGFIYEMFLVSIGADKLLDPAGDGADAKIRFEPHRKGFLNVFSKVTAWIFGVMFGLIFIIITRLMKKPDPNKPPEIEWKEIDGIPKPGKPVELGKVTSGILKWFFNRVDMFGLADSFVSGARLVGVAQ